MHVRLEGPATKAFECDDGRHQLRGRTSAEIEGTASKEHWSVGYIVTGQSFYERAVTISVLGLVESFFLTCNESVFLNLFPLIEAS